MTTPILKESVGVQIPGFQSSIGTLSNVVSSQTSQVMLSANPLRKGFTIFNDSTSIAYIAYAATSSSSGYTFPLQASAYYESEALCYQGVISIIWVTANGNARVTELT